MNIGIVGSRDYKFRSNVEFYIELLHKRIGDDLTIVSGGARGVDSYAEQYSDQHNINKKIFYAEWEKYGKGAGHKRNIVLADYVDGLIVFWNGLYSPGTLHVGDYSNSIHKPTLVLIEDDPVPYMNIEAKSFFKFLK